MSKHNKQNHQPRSQHPAHQQVATRPGAVKDGEVSQDTERVPSAATESQSQVDASAADPDRYQPQDGVTETDPVPGEETDIEADNDEDEDSDKEPGDDEDTGDDDGGDFQGFEDINTRPKRIRREGSDGGGAAVAVAERPVIEVSRTAEEHEQYQAELVPVIPRKTQQRVNIGGEWYNFIKGIEQFVPRSVADHIRDKGLI